MTQYNNIVNGFFSYVDEFPFESDVEKLHILRIADSVFSDINTYLDSWVEQELQQKGSIADEEVRTQLYVQIEEFLSLCTKLLENLGIFNSNVQNEIYDKYKDDLNNAIKYFFEKYVLPDDKLSQLRRIVIHAASIAMGDTEIVIAGFGEKEYLPRCQSFFVDGILCNHTIQRKDTERQYEVKVGTEDFAAIIPFAQSDEVGTFIDGVSPYLKDFMTSTFQRIFGENGACRKDCLKT